MKYRFDGDGYAGSDYLNIVEHLKVAGVYDSKATVWVGYDNGIALLGRIPADEEK